MSSLLCVSDKAENVCVWGGEETLVPNAAVINRENNIVMCSGGEARAAQDLV